MNTSLLFKNAIFNLYKYKIYTVDYAIIKASDYADKNKINAGDYEELLEYLAQEQEREMSVEESEQSESEADIDEQQEEPEESEAE